MKRANDLRNLPTPELAGTATELRREYQSILESVKNGKEKNHAKLRQARRDVARAETILREKLKIA